MNTKQINEIKNINKRLLHRSINERHAIISDFMKIKIPFAKFSEVISEK